MKSETTLDWKTCSFVRVCHKAFHNVHEILGRFTLRVWLVVSCWLVVARFLILRSVNLLDNFTCMPNMIGGRADVKHVVHQ